MKGRTYLVRDEGEFTYAHVVCVQSGGKAVVECLKEGIGKTPYEAMCNADNWYDSEKSKEGKSE